MLNNNLSKRPPLVPDRSEDSRFSDLEIVKSAPYSVYAGMPLITPAGQAGKVAPSISKRNYAESARGYASIIAPGCYPT